MSNSFYAITTLKLDLDNETVVRSRSIGFFWDEETARECVAGNGGDWMEAGWYDHAVIEKYTTEGLYCRPKASWWYMSYMPKYFTLSCDVEIVECERPDMFKNSNGYGAFG